MQVANLAAHLSKAFVSIPRLPSLQHCAAITATAATLAFAPATHAVVVVSPAFNIPVPANTEGVYINVVTGVAGAAINAPGWDINPYGTAQLAFFNPTAPTGGVYVVGAGTTPINLAVGTVITAGSSFGSGGANFTTGWNLTATNYLGFRFLNEANGQVHYGYAAIAVGSAVTTRTVTRIFYESVPGASISVVPEPASVAMMLLAMLTLVS